MGDCLDECLLGRMLAWMLAYFDDWVLAFMYANLLFPTRSPTSVTSSGCSWLWGCQLTLDASPRLSTFLPEEVVSYLSECLNMHASPPADK